MNPENDCPGLLKFCHSGKITSNLVTRIVETFQDLKPIRMTEVAGLLQLSNRLRKNNGDLFLNRGVSFIISN